MRACDDRDWDGSQGNERSRDGAVVGSLGRKIQGRVGQHDIFVTCSRWASKMPTSSMANSRCKARGWRVGSVTSTLSVRARGSSLARMWEGVVGMAVLHG